MFTENLNEFFGTADFAIAATYTPYGGQASTINVIFDAPGLNTMGIGGTDSTVIVKASDVAGFTNRATLVVSGVTYRIIQSTPMDDGVLTTLQLERQ